MAGWREFYRSTRRAIARTSLAAVIGVAILAWPGGSTAFQLSPQGTRFENALARKYGNWWRRVLQWVANRGVHLFSEAVHEEITQRIFGCEGDADVCGDPNGEHAGPYIIAGARWNDDPPFRLQPGGGRGLSCKITETIRFSTQPLCWAGLFTDAKKRAKRGEPMDAKSRASLLARSHFGDLQFLHAMASRDGESAKVTQRRVLMWAEFTWRLATGEYGLGAKLKEVPVEGLSEFFGQTDWRVQDLFTLGNIALRPRIREVAFGSLLHMVEDSFAKGHVDRREAILGEKCPGSASAHEAPGKILEFHAYGKQDTAKHAEADSREAFSLHWSGEKPSVIDVGGTLRDYFQRNETWETVRPYVECVFALENPDQPASPGPAFRDEE